MPEDRASVHKAREDEEESQVAGSIHLARTGELELSQCPEDKTERRGVEEIGTQEEFIEQGVEL